MVDVWTPIDSCDLARGIDGCPIKSSIKREVLDAYQKKNGALTFFVIGFRFEDARSGEPYCSARQVAIRAEDADCAEVEVYARQQNDVLIASGSAVVRVP